MKKILILLALPLLFNSCLKDDEDKFSKSATERIEEAVKEAITVLQGAENGWRDGSCIPKASAFYGGYTLFLKFNADIRSSLPVRISLRAKPNRPTIRWLRRAVFACRNFWKEHAHRSARYYAQPPHRNFLFPLHGFCRGLCRLSCGLPGKPDGKQGLSFDLPTWAFPLP